MKPRWMKRLRRAVGGLAFVVIVAIAITYIVSRIDRSERIGANESDSRISMAFEEYRLDNGLQVILHVDRSDPIAAVLMTFRVGSARDDPNRTGLAHLFEHLFFLDSENLGPGGLDRLMNRVGARALPQASATAGSTNEDRTNYFEVVPVDALEKALWAEADKLGFFINTVTEAVLEKEKQVVKNEYRQRNFNAPYGHTDDVISRALFPDDHPYSWMASNSLAHVDATTLEHVRAFHERWYGPNNAVLAVSGDIDVEQTKAWIERYFDEIPSRPMSDPAEPPAHRLEAARYLFHEDDFAELPELTITWPGVPLFHPDSYALGVLAEALGNGKAAPLFAAIVSDSQLAPDVSMTTVSSELAGYMTLRIRAHAGTDLDDVLEAIEVAFDRFEAEGVSSADLARIKAGDEVEFYSGISTVLGKAMQLTRYSLFAPETGYLNEDLRRTLSVSTQDVMRVYDTYVRGRPYVATSFVPRGSESLALEGSVRADVAVDAPIVPGEREVAVQVAREDIVRTPSLIDRSVEPPFSDAPSLRSPAVDRFELENGLNVFVITDDEAPLVSFSLRVRSGQLREDSTLHGVANFLAEMLMEGTENRTPEELEIALGLLGATLDVRAEPECLTFSGSVLARNFAPAMRLLAEVVLAPRWDADRFTLVRDRIRTALRERAADPVSLAEDAFQSLVYGDHVLGRSLLGTPESVNAMTLDDLRGFHSAALIPNAANLHVVGAVDLGQVEEAVGVFGGWQRGRSVIPEEPKWDQSRAGLYFLDVPGSAQSVVRVGYLALAQTDEDFYPAEIMNFRLGGGGFASDLTQVLREQYGYTYLIRSRFAGSEFKGPFSIQASIRSDVTLESLELIKNLVERHGPEFDSEDLDATQSYLLRSNASAFEALEAKLEMLEDISALGFSDDYVLEREATVRVMTVEQIRELARRYLNPDEMVWLVVGDAATQLERLAGLNLGEPILLERHE